MVSVTPGQAFLNLGKNPKSDRLSKRRRKSRGTKHNSTARDRQSYYEDCHIWHHVLRRIPNSPCKGCLSNGYGLPARTLRVVGTAHNGTGDSEGIFLATENSCWSFFLLIYSDLEKDNPNPIQRTLAMRPYGFWISRWLILQILWMDGSFFSSLLRMQAD
jgi:hypothetical protein